MAWSPESCRAAGLKAAIIFCGEGTSEEEVISLAHRFATWISQANPLGPTGPVGMPVLAPTPGEAATAPMPVPGASPFRGQPAHVPACRNGSCPVCDGARGRGEIT